MPTSKQIERIAELTAMIAELPKGYISEKNINGKVYFYHQWSEQGQKMSKYLRDGEVEPLTKKIEQRKLLQAELRQLKQGSSSGKGRGDLQMRCTLMHKKIPVVQMELDQASGFIQMVGDVYAPDHLPLGVMMRQGRIDRKSLNDWWTDRSIPASRSGIREALEALEISNTRMLLIRCLGLSLSDQYWILPEGADLSWERINFFANPFSDDIGDVLFGASKRTDALDLSSPDNTSDGNLKKRWKIIEGKRFLVKGGSNPFRQQPFNEVIADGIMQRLGIPHVHYKVVWDKGAPYSLCEDFISDETELIPAWRIVQTRKKRSSVSMYRHFVDCADDLGIPEVIPFLDRMIVLDYIIANEDRHLNNFGAVRDAETLEWIGMAPIYDSGSSLGYDKVASEIRSSKDIICKPFKSRHEDQLKLVTDFSWFDPSLLSDVRDLITETLSTDGAKEYMDDARIKAIADSVEQRILRVKELSDAKDPIKKDLVEDDVKRNVAEDYKADKM